MAPIGALSKSKPIVSSVTSAQVAGFHTDGGRTRVRDVERRPELLAVATGPSAALCAGGKAKDIVTA